MNTPKSLTIVAATALVALVMLALAVGLTQAQGPGPEDSDLLHAEAAIAGQVGGSIPIQGRLTDDQGNPLEGPHDLTFRLYNSTSVAATILCTDTDTVDVADGLFNTYISGCSGHVTGEQLYVGIEVGSDGEMEPRQPLYTVPYALSLRPGAIISNSSSSEILTVRNEGDGAGLYGIGTPGVLGENDGFGHGIVGRAGLLGAGVKGEGHALGFGGLFTNTEGIALRVESDDIGLQVESDGVAIEASGSGRIKSTANSYIWISGNNLVKANSDDTTEFERDLYGGFKVSGGADWGNPKVVVLPVTIPGQLYGQNVTVTGLDLYYRVSADLTAITAISMRRQNGVDAGDLVFSDGTDYACIATQCDEHWDLTQNNVLSDQRGILYIAFELGFPDDTAYVHIGGVRLTLEHD